MLQEMTFLPKAHTTEQSRGSDIGGTRYRYYAMLAELLKKITENASNRLGGVTFALLIGSHIDSDFYLPVIVLVEVKSEVAYDGQRRPIQDHQLEPSPGCIWCQSILLFD